VIWLFERGTLARNPDEEQKHSATAAVATAAASYRVCRKLHIRKKRPKGKEGLYGRTQALKVKVKIKVKVKDRDRERKK